MENAHNIPPWVWRMSREKGHGRRPRKDDLERLAALRQFGGGFGFRGGPPFGPPFGGGRGRRRRGDVRLAVLMLLREEPRNGYQLMQEIEARSEGRWRPSPGSVYPTLAQLEDEGLIRAEAAEGGRRAYQLTDEGRSYVEAHPDEVRAPWDVVAGAVGDTAIEMRNLVGQVNMAAFQVVSAGTEGQISQARQVLTDTRKALYRLLAADDEDTSADPGQ